MAFRPSHKLCKRASDIICGKLLLQKTSKNRKNWNINILVSEWRWRKYHNCSQDSVLEAFEKLKLKLADDNNDSNFIETNNLLNPACGKSECQSLIVSMLYVHTVCNILYVTYYMVHAVFITLSVCTSCVHKMRKCSSINKFWDGFCCQYDADFGKLCPVGALQPIRYMNDTSPVSKKNLIYLIKKF